MVCKVYLVIKKLTKAQKLIRSAWILTDFNGTGVEYTPPF